MATIKEWKTVIDNLNRQIKKVPTIQQLQKYFSIATYVLEDCPEEKDTAFWCSEYAKRWCEDICVNSSDRKLVENCWSLRWDILKWEAPYLFESFLLYMEKNRKPEKRFYMPRRKTLHVVVQDLQDLEDGKIKFLGISLPPRVGKSTLCIFFMTWVIGRHKSSHNAMSGHSGILADRFYRDVMKLATDPEYTFSEIFPDVKLEDKSSDKNELFFDKKEAFATLTCRGIDGTWTGAVDISADGYLYVDDMIRDRTESLSQIRLENRYQDYLNVLVDRKNDGSKELMVGTRWNVLDPLGRVEAKNKDNPLYRFRKIPALNENDESNFVYDYGVGFSTEYYKDMRSRLDKNEWMAKFQQNPFVREGLVFPEEELHYFNGVVPEDASTNWSVCDPAFGGVDHLSSPIGSFNKDLPESLIYIPDVVFEQGDKDKTTPILAGKLIEYGVTRLQIEKNNAGIYYANFVEEKMKERNYKINITTKYSSNKMSKEEKILLYSSDIKRRCVFLEEGKRSTQYQKAMETLFMYTSVGKNVSDDFADSLAQLIELVEINTTNTVQAVQNPYRRY